MKERIFPRLLIGGTNSGCGKTTVTAALLQAWKGRGLHVAAFKCGPDYIDPMFQQKITGEPSVNLDGLFLEKEKLRQLFAWHACGHDMALIEGVMGYYDGQGDTDRASSYETARSLKVPAVLVLQPAGNSLSSAAMIEGYKNFRRPSMISGIILNGIRENMYNFYREMIERETGIKVYGFLPKTPDISFKSRHLGLVTAAEQNYLDKKLKCLGDLAEKYVDLDGLCQLAAKAPELKYEEAFQKFNKIAEVRVAVAFDSAFCFYYSENLECLRRLGARIVYFSPLEDEHLPEDIQGIYLGGGYPELYGARLSQNLTMIEEIRQAAGYLPVLAECGGYMYLAESMEDREGQVWPMAGVVSGRCRMTEKLAPFGYVRLGCGQDSLLGKKGQTFTGHEFHYSVMEGADKDFFMEKKNGRRWTGGTAGQKIYAAYPHLYFYGNEETAENFVRAMEAVKDGC